MKNSLAHCNILHYFDVDLMKYECIQLIGNTNRAIFQVCTTHIFGVAIFECFYLTFFLAFLYYSYGKCGQDAFVFASVQEKDEHAPCCITKIVAK